MGIESERMNFGQRADGLQLCIVSGQGKVSVRECVEATGDVQ